MRFVEVVCFQSGLVCFGLISVSFQVIWFVFQSGSICKGGLFSKWCVLRWFGFQSGSVCRGDLVCFEVVCFPGDLL